MSCGKDLNLPGHRCKSYLNNSKFLPKLIKEATHRWRQIVALVGNDAREVQLERARPLADGNAIFEAEGAHLANQLGSVCHDTITDAMQSLQVELLTRLDLDKSHCRAGDRFSNCFSISRVILV